MANLYFDRKGEKVKKELISKPFLIEKGKDWELYSLPTHEKHTYNIHRYHFRSELTIETHGICHVLSLVEGTSVLIETSRGIRKRFRYAETFVVPAAAESIKVTHEEPGSAILVVAFMK